MPLPASIETLSLKVLSDEIKKKRNWRGRIRKEGCYGLVQEEETEKKKKTEERKERRKTQKREKEEDHGFECLMLTWRMAELKSALTSQGEPTGLGLKEKEEEKSTQGHFWKIQSRKVNWAWAQLITTPTRPINNCYSHPSPISRPKSQAQSVLGPEESKAQLKWASATSKDGSDYDPPSPV
jgi:hypothetical protein